MKNNDTSSFPLPTFTDIARGYLIINRILLRKNFETLKNRKNSKYFKNIIIKDVPWGVNTPIPPNFPQEIKDLYPSDFSVEFTTLGCNMLKCYKHDYNKPCFGSSPFVINNLHLACNAACYEVFEEFNEFIREKFEIKKILQQRQQQQLRKELDFETFSMEKHYNDGTGIEKSFCGIQLVNLKRFAIYPASRYLLEEKKNNNNDDSIFLTDEEFIKISNNEPIKLCDMAGLVDSPPLTWDTAQQNVNFNEEYCKRFRKYYDKENDECRTFKHRVMLNYIFGNNVVNQFSDQDALLLMGSPIGFIVKTAVGNDNNQFSLNPLYSEKRINQKKLERAYFHSKPDRIFNRIDKINIIEPKNNNNFSLCQIKENIVTEISNDIGKNVVEILKSMGETVLMEEGLISSPILLSYLLKYYSQSFINRVFLAKGGGGIAAAAIPNCLNLAVLIVKTVVVEMMVKTATRILISLSQVMNVILSIGIITIIPDILLAKYNIGGYNREITRESLSKQRTNFINNLVREVLHSSSSSSSSSLPLSISPELSFISINNNNDDENNDDSTYITPLITPEYVYSLCLLNFHNTHSNDEVIKIGHVGINPEEERELVQKYLSFLKINSAGQRVIIMNDDDDASLIISSLDDMIGNNDIDKVIKKNKINTATLENMPEIMQKRVDDINAIYDYKSMDVTQQIIATNNDLYFLWASILIVFVLCFYVYLLFCNCFCKIKTTIMFTFIFICLYLLWVNIFKLKIHKHSEIYL